MIVFQIIAIAAALFAATAVPTRQFVGPLSRKQIIKELQSQAHPESHQLLFRRVVGHVAHDPAVSSREQLFSRDVLKSLQRFTSQEHSSSHLHLGKTVNILFDLHGNGLDNIVSRIAKKERVAQLRRRLQSRSVGLDYFVAKPNESIKTLRDLFDARSALFKNKAAHSEEQRETVFRLSSSTLSSNIIKAKDTLDARGNANSVRPKSGEIRISEDSFKQQNLIALSRDGLTADPCTSDGDCQGDRQCIALSADVCSSSLTNCICIPPQLISCTSSTDCPTGEVCATIGSGQICVSATQTAVTSPAPEPTPSPPSSGGTGLTGDECSSSDDCKGDRSCFDVDTEDICDGGTRCICVPPQLIDCTSDADCPAGEGCTDLTSGSSVCVSIAAGGGGGGSGASTTAPSTTGPSSGGLGLTGDTCSTTSDCAGDRTCIDLDSAALCDGGTTCVCIPPELVNCTSDADCPTGEGCTDLSSGGAVCVSIAAGGGGGGGGGGGTSAPTTTASSTTDPSSGGSGGLTGDQCSSTSDCDGDRQCVDLDAQALCDGGTSCICFPQQLIDCTSDADCPAGEGCTDQNSGGAVCVSIAAGGGGGGGGGTSAPSTTAPSTTGPSSGGLGLTGDSCSTASDCAGDRTCVDFNAQALCDGGTTCICIPPELIECTSDADCPAGEGCTDQNAGGAVCVSIAAGGGGGGGGGTSAPSTTVPSTTGPSSGGLGLTGDSCSTTSDCAGDRTCFDVDADDVCDGGTTCLCIPPEFIDCTSDADCPPGEGCTDLSSGDAVCVSIAIGGGGGGSGASEPSPSPMEATPASTGSGLTGDVCSSDDDCEGNRQCLSGSAAPCSGIDSCICVPEEIITCTSDSDCPIGEVCSVIGDSQICVSEAIV